MSEKTIGKDVAEAAGIFQHLEEICLNSIREVLPDRIIDQGCREVGHRYRKRTLTPIVTVFHMLLSALWPEDSFAAGWQTFWASVVGRFPDKAGSSPTLGSVAKARARLPLSLWSWLFAWISTQAQELSEQFACWRGHRLVLMDGSCVSMPDVRDLHAEFGTSTGRYGKGKYPLARLVTVCLAGTMTVLGYALGRYRDDENALAEPLLKKLRRGDLLIADRHFAGAHLYNKYQAAGLEFLTRAHQRLKISRLGRIISYAGNDFVTDLLVDPAHRRANPCAPKQVRVRLIQAVLRIRGRRQVVWFVTSLLDGDLYPAEEIVALYGARWRIETLFRQVKIELSADVLRSQTAAGVRKEIAARLIALNVVRIIMLESAIEHEVDPVRISFIHTVRAILSFAPAFATEPLWKLPQIYKAMLTEIASHPVPERVGRLEPRAVRRETKHYPTLRTTRAQWRRRYAA